jgi:hypothetical protein
MYVDLSGSGSAQPVAYLTKWSLKSATDKFEVTAFEDGNKTYVSGKEDAQGDFSGFYDTSTAQLYTAATDGAARKFYLYPDHTVGSAGPYFFGTAIFDFNIEAMVDGAVSVSGSFAAASDVNKIG